MTHPLEDADLPGFWKDADRASLRGQKKKLWCDRLRLGGSIAAAFGSAFSLHIVHFDVSAAIIGIGFLVVFISERITKILKLDKRWYEGRALAESAKTLSWRYAVGADPFQLELGEDEARDRLRERFGKISEGVSFVRISSPDPLVTPGMEALRKSNFEKRRDAYIKGRTENQQKWYAKKFETNSRLADGWSVFFLVAEVAALLLAAIRVIGGWNIDFAGLMASVITAGVGWTAIKQFSPLATAYSVAAKELAIQGDRLRTVSEDDWPLVVADAEEAISREHTMWLASRIGGINET
ncbi:DUF4231 domain-containing protein [Propionibacterium acidifaciens]|uniref:DUF4231 domain-containing protein n=1 Tax=Propionibacterium acidifaciens TaxID=556499 RepID=UPI0028E8DC6D|nr:DUF4231 domain-containing protein [Propionibacterium acidifaciens]